MTQQTSVTPAHVIGVRRNRLPATKSSRYGCRMTLPDRRHELEEFKTQINLLEYMSGHGYALDRRKSSRSSAVMRNDSGDKLVVARGRRGHWMYFNPHDDRDQGTIIDFCQLRLRCSLGEVRKELRQHLGRTSEIAVAVPKKFAELAPSEHDLARVLAVWERARPIEGSHRYLEQRNISLAVLSDPIFADRIRSDRRGNALFLHHNQDGICGYEVKNRGFTGMSPGGLKGLFSSRPRSTDRELVICETAIDALSYATLFGTVGTRFVSTAGTVSPAQVALLQSAAQKMPTASRILLATDNDPAGRELAEKIAAALADIPLAGRTVEYCLPGGEGDDWNDILRRTGSDSHAAPSLS